MAPVIAAAVAHGVPLALHEALSGVFGSISLAAWIFLLVRSFTVYLPSRYVRRTSSFLALFSEACPEL